LDKLISLDIFAGFAPLRETLRVFSNESSLTAICFSGDRLCRGLVPIVPFR
jgi:hypothetical protein